LTNKSIDKGEVISFPNGKDRYISFASITSSHLRCLVGDW